MKHYTITVNGVPYDVTVQPGAIPAAPVVAPPVAAAPVAPAAPAAEPVAAAPVEAPVGGQPGSVVISAPMPGNVLDVKVSPGQAVKNGDVLVVLEAMKMENDIVAPQDGTVASVNCAKGDIVNVGDTFLTLQ